MDRNQWDTGMEREPTGMQRIGQDAALTSWRDPLASPLIKPRLLVTTVTYLHSEGDDNFLIFLNFSIYLSTYL